MGDFNRRETLHLSGNRSNRSKPFQRFSKSGKPDKQIIKGEPKLDTHTRRLEALKQSGAPCDISFSHTEEGLTGVQILDYDKYTVEASFTRSGAVIKAVIFKSVIADISVNGDWPVFAQPTAKEVVEEETEQDDSIGNRI